MQQLSVRPAAVRARRWPRPGWRLAGPVAGLLLLCAPSFAPAQTRVVAGADAFVRSAYLWRGIPRATAWVLQPNAYVSLETGTAFATAGWWGNVEIAPADAGDTGAAGLGATVGENDLWLDLSAPVGRLRVSGGVTRYSFARGAFGQAADAANTTELYLAAWGNLGPAVPGISLWYDVDEVRGGYAEAGVDLRVPTLPSEDPVLALYISALAGWSFGQETNEGRPGQAAYFSEGGLTHVDLGLELLVGKDRRYVTLETHVVVGSDDGARAGRLGPPETRPGTSWWLGVGVSDAWVVGAL